MTRGSLFGLLALALLGAASWLALRPSGAPPGVVSVEASDSRAGVESTGGEPTVAPPAAASQVRVLTPAAAEAPASENALLLPVPRGPLLEVVAAGTDTHLAEVDVYYRPPSHSTCTHPLGQRWKRLAGSESSPVELHPEKVPGRSSHVRLVVGARGYAWTRMKLDLAEVGTQRVELEPAGSLRVDYDGVAPEGSHLRLYADGVPLAEQWLESETTTWDGLSPGIYRVSIEVGSWFNEPAVMGEQEVEIRAGEAAAVRLLVQVPTVINTAPLTGTLVVPTEWGELEHALTLQQLTSSADGVKTTTQFKGDALAAVPGQEGHYAFSVPELEVGVYFLRYETLNWTHAFEHSPEGTHQYRLEVPPPVSVTVRVVLNGTEEPAVDVERLLWRPISAEGVEGGKQTTAEREQGTHVFALLVPLGRFEVAALQTGYAFDYVEFDASTDADFVLEAKQNPK